MKIHNLENLNQRMSSEIVHHIVLLLLEFKLCFGQFLYII